MKIKSSLTVSLSVIFGTIIGQTQLIQNGNLSNSTGWSTYGDMYISSGFTCYNSSSSYAFGGCDAGGSGINNASGFLYQTISIPVNTTSATLTYSISINTDEVASSVYDYIQVYIADFSWNALTQINQYSNLDGNYSSGGCQTYQSHSLSIPSNLSGQTVQVVFYAATDGSNSTKLRIDDVSLIANTSTGCTPVTIITHPQSQTANVGGSVVFSVTAANGTLPYSYQWYKNTNAIIGGNNPTYTTPTLNAIDNGNTYYCKVTNCPGNGNYFDISNTATLTVGSPTPTITLTSPNGGEYWLMGSSQNIIANFSSSIVGVSLEYSIDGGITYPFSITGPMSIPGTSVSIPWTIPNQLSTQCKVKITGFYSGGNISDVSDNVFTIYNPLGQGFSLNPTLSHLRWPFENSDWVNRNGWYGGTEPQGQAIQAAGHGQNYHHWGDYYADDWNSTTVIDCNLNFLSPIAGNVIFVYTACATDCGVTPNCPDGYNCTAPSSVYSPSGYGNEIIIQSSLDNNYAFRVCHLNQLNVVAGQTVNVGDLLGKIGNTGGASGSHAHCVLYQGINNYESFFSDYGINRLLCGKSLRIDNLSASGYNQFAANFLFDAVNGGYGGGQDTVSVNNSTSNQHSFKVYPNPNSGNFILEFQSFDSKYTRVRVLNPLGEIVYVNEITNIKTEINLNAASNGIYYVQIERDDNFFSKKIVIAK